jgi:hypothetical protein
VDACSTSAEYRRSKAKFVADISVGIVTRYWLNDRRIVRLPTRVGNLCFLHKVQIGSGTHSASYPMGSVDSLPGIKAAGA